MSVIPEFDLEAEDVREGRHGRAELRDGQGDPVDSPELVVRGDRPSLLGLRIDIYGRFRGNEFEFDLVPDCRIGESSR